jgi:hypothetical protein
LPHAAAVIADPLDLAFPRTGDALDAVVSAASFHDQFCIGFAMFAP